MGQKVHPYGFRLGVNKPWRSRWFVVRDYDKLLIEDVQLKRELKEKLKLAGVSSVEVERPGKKLRLIIRTARPGIVIGRKGAEIDKLKAEIQERTKRDVTIDIVEVNKPELDAQLVAESIALKLEKRSGFRRVMRMAVDSALRFGCKGIKVRVSGRQRDRAFGVVPAGPIAAAHAARRYRLRLCRGVHDVRCDRREGMDLSRRCV
jgi:small subunit ribosomal protein S3